jgi:hypothetical protein
MLDSDALHCDQQLTNFVGTDTDNDDGRRDVGRKELKSQMAVMLGLAFEMRFMFSFCSHPAAELEGDFASLHMRSTRSVISSLRPSLRNPERYVKSPITSPSLLDHPVRILPDRPVVRRRRLIPSKHSKRMFRRQEQRPWSSCHHRVRNACNA